MNNLDIILFTLLGSIGSLFFKLATLKSKKAIQIILSPYLYIGVIFYFFSIIINTIVIRNYKYSFVLPLTSITYIWTFVFSYFFLKENITRYKIIGISLIFLGALVLSW